jgi:uncharacterized protein YcnI
VGTKRRRAWTTVCKQCEAHGREIPGRDTQCAYPRFSRALIITAAASVLIALSCGVASAHVTVDAPGAARGGNAVLTFRVPNESATGSPTVALTVQFPALAVADTAPIPGWKAAVSKDAKQSGHRDHLDR